MRSRRPQRRFFASLADALKHRLGRHVSAHRHLVQRQVDFEALDACATRRGESPNSFACMRAKIRARQRPRDREARGCCIRVRCCRVSAAARPHPPFSQERESLRLCSRRTSWPLSAPPAAARASELDDAARPRVARAAGGAPPACLRQRDSARNAACGGRSRSTQRARRERGAG